MFKWMSSQSCLNWLLEVIPHGGRIGPLIVVGLINDSPVSANWKVPPAINYQVYFFQIFSVSLVRHLLGILISEINLELVIEKLWFLKFGQEFQLTYKQLIFSEVSTRCR